MLTKTALHWIDIFPKFTRFQKLVVTNVLCRASQFHGDDESVNKLRGIKYVF